MWKDDNDKIEELYVKKNKDKFPAICPVCKKNAAHMYMHVYNNATRRGGLWVWCSECKIFSHSSAYVPEYWENCSLVEMEKLCAIPDYLDEIKDIIDAHVNTIRN
ncbi:MAG: hypothetical protein NC307_09395 [Roseburia sp.]|nr:hypothetical protein [Roseburia sp.]